MAVKDVLDLVKKNKVEIVDFKFIDVPGLWQHFSIPAAELTADLFEDGIGFDGSSIRGFQSINESDMLLIPDPDTALMDPFTEHPTLSLVCNVIDAVTRESYSRDPRYVAQKAEKYLKSSGLADISYWGPEIEFFIFDSIRFDQAQNHGYYYIDSEEGFWNSGNNDKPNLGYKIRYKEGYFPVPPMDQYQDSALRDGQEPGEVRDQDRSAPSRSGHRRADRNRHEVHDLDQDGGSGFVVQVRGQEHRPKAGQSGYRDAQAALSRQRLRHAHPPELVEGWQEPVLRQEGLRADQ